MDQKSEAGVAGAVRHAANNLSMVILSNLELLTRAVAPDTAPARQVERARMAAGKLQAILQPFTRLTRPPMQDRAAPAVALRALLPLLEVAAGGGAPLQLSAAEVPPLPLPRPALDLALLEWAQIAAAESPRGTALRIELEAAADGVVIRLAPNPGGAAGALVEVAALVGGSTRLGPEMAELRLPAG